MIRAFLAVELPTDLRAALATIQEDVKRQLEPNGRSPGEDQLGSTGLDASHAQVPR